MGDPYKKSLRLEYFTIGYDILEASKPSLPGIIIAIRSIIIMPILSRQKRMLGENIESKALAADSR
jgi:divalent metal cation (Fe/Co/Zn/Cd) transporter